MSTKLSKFDKLFEKESQKWFEKPELFETEGIEFLKKHSSRHMEALEILVPILMQRGDPFSANDAIIKAMRNDKKAVKLLELYMLLYSEFSDTPDEALWAANILNDIHDDKIELIKLIIHLYNMKDEKEQAVELYNKAKEKFPDSFSEIEDMTTYMYSGIPEYIEKGKQLVEKFNIEQIDRFDPLFVNVGSMKFYAGFNYDGLVYHFGGEDLRPRDFVSKKEIPNHKTIDFNGKSVVITPYRGMGDSMILSRFIPKFMEKWPGVKLYIATEKPLIPLYKNIPNIKGVGTLESYAGKMFDHCLGINMISRYIREFLVDDQERIRYHEWVAYPPSYDEKWSEFIQTDKPVIGINWKGSQRLGGGGRSDVNTTRDVPFEEFIHIIDLFPNLQFMVLNNDVTDEETQVLSEKSNVLIPHPIKDFGDTAALIKQCDLVVSVDTSISTLSASLSKDTVVMAKFWPDYRWLYYEKWWNLDEVNIDVFRKEKHNSPWTGVLMNVVKRLKDV